MIGLYYALNDLDNVKSWKNVTLANGSFAKVIGFGSLYPCHIFYMLLAIPFFACSPLVRLFKISNVQWVFSPLYVSFRISSWWKRLVRGKKLVACIIFISSIYPLEFSHPSHHLLLNCIVALVILPFPFWNVKLGILEMYLPSLMKRVNLANTIVSFVPWVNNHVSSPSKLIHSDV